jgi:hypothetical protein
LANVKQCVRHGELRSIPDDCDLPMLITFFAKASDSQVCSPNESSMHVYWVSSQAFGIKLGEKGVLNGLAKGSKRKGLPDGTKYPAIRFPLPGIVASPIIHISVRMQRENCLVRRGQGVCSTSSTRARAALRVTSFAPNKSTQTELSGNIKGNVSFELQQDVDSVIKNGGY